MRHAAQFWLHLSFNLRFTNGDDLPRSGNKG